MAATSPELTVADQDPRVARSRARMLAAAGELLVEAGVRGVTADAVAERSGVAKSTLYRHWSSVPELLLDALRANVPPPVPADLHGGFEAALHWWIQQALHALAAPDWARTLPALLELRIHSPEIAALLAADFDNNLTTVASILELGAGEGRVPAGLDPRQVTHTLIGPLVLATLNGDDDQVAELADYVVERFLASYRTTPQPA
jgi:AcrR family transcriptional regulator